MPHYTDREIVNRWALAAINPAISRLLSGKGTMDPGADGCIGFFYVDHTEGIMFRIHSLCRIEPGKPPEIMVDFENHGESLVLPSDEVAPYTLLSNKAANDHSLLEEQRWLLFYEPEAFHALRTRVDLDRFRASGYFDDASAILCPHDQETIPEVVWVRLEDQSCNGAYFRGTLLNAPHANFGVHGGDMLMVRFAEHEGERILVADTVPP